MGFMVIEKIVSFLPSATELLYEIGAKDMIVGVTHECLYPEDAKSKPRVISSVFDSEVLTSREIDQRTCQLLNEKKDIFTLNEVTLRKTKPDLIISQNTCEVCAAHTNQLNRAIEILEKKPKIFSMDPHTVEDILDCVLVLSRLIGKEKQGKILLKSLQTRIDIIKNKIFKTKPKVLAIEWLDPFFTSGHWVPEMIQIAGGHNEISKKGEHSRRLAIEEIEESNPDIIVLMPCGFNTQRTLSEYENSLSKNERWNHLDAVKNHRVYAVDANSYFSKPSIRTIQGIEILSKIIHPECFTDISLHDSTYKISK